MALQKTFSGDLTTSIAKSIFDIISDARGEKEKATKEAEKYGVDVDFTPGEFTARSARNRLIERTLGNRFVPETRYPDLLARGQSSSDPLMGTPAHLRKLPEYQQLANPKEQAFNQSSYATGRNIPSMQPKSSGTSGTTSTVAKPVKVKDQKLGVFLAAVVKALNENISSLNERLNDTEGQVIAAKEGIFGTIKQLEQNSDVLETKLDAIIDALREQNNLAKVQEDQSEIKSREGELEIEKDDSGTERFVGTDEDPEKVAQLNIIEEANELSSIGDVDDMSGGYPYSDLGPGFEQGGIASGPDSGYLAKLHGDEMIIPLDNNYTQGEPSAIDGKIRPKPQTPMMPQMAESGMMPKTVEKPSSFDTFGGNLFNKVVSAEPEVIPDLKDDIGNLQKAMQVPIKAAGVITLNKMQKALPAMGYAAGEVATELQSVSGPIAKTFGVPNTITDSIVRQNTVESQREKRRAERKASDNEDDRNIFQKILDFFRGNQQGGDGGGYRRGGGGNRTIRRYNQPPTGGTGGPGGLARGLKGARAGFTGMNAQGFNAMMQGQGYIPSSKPQILGKGAYSAPTFRGALRYAGTSGSLGGSQLPGGVVNSIVPGGAPRINFIEPQAKVNPAMFNKGRDLATRLQGGAYPNSTRANMFRGQIRTGGVRAPIRGVPKISHPLIMLADMIINDLLNPDPVGTYDQVTGPNAMYNNPKLSEEQRRKMFKQIHGTATGPLKSELVNSQSQELVLSKFIKKTTPLEPIVINNNQTASSTQDNPISFINLVGDPGFSSLFPPPF
tara:strand:- start:6216 stop:8567 length:2352 start_codon:yes stop_codon:yes gene_type:complete